MSNLMFIGEIIPEMIYEKPTNNVGGWSYATRPEAEDSKFYELDGEWLYVVKDKAELESLRDQGSWLTSTDPNQLVSITDKDNVTKSIPINNLVTTRVNNMNNMFGDKSSFNQDIGNWDVSNVTDMYRMFQNTSFNQNISGWDVSNVTIMRRMFDGSSFNQDIGGWDVSNVTNMEWMFRDTPFNKDISMWDVSNVTTMVGMFYNTPFNKDISMWDISNVTTMRSMFRESSFNQDIGGWDVSNVAYMGYMFMNNHHFNQDLSSWCVSHYSFRPSDFDYGTTAWKLPKPNWGAPC